MLKIFTLIIFLWSADDANFEGMSTVSFVSEFDCQAAAAYAMQRGDETLYQVEAFCIPTVVYGAEPVPE